jgi:hypothetical protein
MEEQASLTLETEQSKRPVERLLAAPPSPAVTQPPQRPRMCARDPTPARG